MSRPDPLTFERRRFLTGAAAGLGSLLLAPRLGATTPLANPGGGLPGLPHFAPKAKRIVWLHMAGGPSSLDLFDPKPKLVEHDGEEVPASYTEGERFAFIEGTPKLLGSPYAFARHGESGAWVSELLPHTAGIADKLCLVRTMRTTQFNHAPAQLYLTSGYERVGRPSMGAWLSHGLGAEAGEGADRVHERHRVVPLVQVGAAAAGHDGHAVERADAELAGVTDDGRLGESGDLGVRNGDEVAQAINDFTESGSEHQPQKGTVGPRIGAANGCDRTVHRLEHAGHAASKSAVPPAGPGRATYRATDTAYAAGAQPQETR